jgi:hypothetical protein
VAPRHRDRCPSIGRPVRSAYFCATAPTWVCTWLILLTGGSPLSTRLDWSVPQPRWCILLAARNVQPASCCPSVVLCNPTAQLRASKYGLRVSNREEHGVKWHKHPTVFRTPLTSTVRSPMRRMSIKTRYEGCTLSCVLSKESDRPRVEYMSLVLRLCSLNHCAKVRISTYALARGNVDASMACC